MEREKVDDRGERIRKAIKNLMILGFAVAFWFVPIPSARHPDARWPVNDMMNRISAVVSATCAVGVLAPETEGFSAKAVGAEMHVVRAGAHPLVLTYAHDNIVAITLCELVALVLYWLIFCRVKRRLTKVLVGAGCFVLMVSTVLVLRAAVFGMLAVTWWSLSFVRWCDDPIRMLILLFAFGAFLVPMAGTKSKERS